MKAFEPFRIGKLELKNRLVVSAMVTNYCNPDGTPTEKYLAYHEHKARGGWGLIITEDYAIAPKAGGFIRLPGLWEDSQIQPHQELTRRVHQAGGKIVVQIYHAGRETSSAITGERPVGPSPIREPSMPETPRELTVEEIHQLVEQFGDCARRAQQAGFDGVEVHGAHGYLVGAFASPFANKRCDEYGGTIQNRTRFAVEIIRNIKQKCGADFPVLYRMSAVEYVPGGLVGAETADTLSQSCQVSVIEMQPRIMGDGEYSTAYYMKQRFQQFGVQVYTSTKVLEIGSHTVAAEREGQAITLEDVDFVVIAVGVKTDTALFDQLEGLPWPVYKVGDANGVKNGYLGIREGFEAGLAL